MRNTRRRLAVLFTAAVFAAASLAGCVKRETPERLMDTMTENIEEIRSFSNEIYLDISMEDVIYSTEVSMEMKTESTSRPKAGHAKASTNIKMRGTELSNTLEVYQVTEDGEAVTYSGVDGVWSRESAKGSFEENTASGLSVGNNLFQKIGDSLHSFHVAKKTVETEGKECYQMYGDVTGKDLMGLLGKEMLLGYGLAELPDEESIAGLKVPIIFEVYKKELLPARMIVDMTDVLDSLYEEMGESAHVNKFTIRLLFTGYNEVEPILVPEEVRRLAGSTAP